MGFSLQLRDLYRALGCTEMRRSRCASRRRSHLQRVDLCHRVVVVIQRDIEMVGIPLSRHSSP